MEKAAEKLELIVKYFSNLTPRQLEQFTALQDLYRHWNSQINVISRKDIDSLYEKHVLHSLSIAALRGFDAGTEIIDIGTGGGFPGIPLAIFFPEVRFHLTDSIGKKIKVVREVAAAIGLMNITTQQTRAEEIRARNFDYAVSRAVAPLTDLVKWSRPLLRSTIPPGKMEAQSLSLINEHLGPGLICLKGGDLAAEIAQIAVSPTILDIHEIFQEPFFIKKYLLFVPAV